MRDKIRLNSISDIYSLRIKRLTSSFNKIKLDNYTVLKDENIFYLTGFYGKDSNSMLLISPEKSYLLVNFIYLEEAKKAISDPKIEVFLYKKNRFKKLVEIFESHNFRSLGIESTQIDHISYTKLENMLSKTGNKLISKHGLVEDLRIIKDDYELENIRKACRITDLAFEKVINSSSGKITKFSELSLGIEIERLLIKNGGNGRSFDFVIAGGTNSSRPHYLSGHIGIEEDILLMDFGTIYNRYCSDITRTIFLKNMPSASKLRHIYNIVLEAQLMAIQACCEGIRCDELDRIARKHIERYGYGEKFGHGLGHGVGLEVHEEPAVTGRNKTVLKENMVVTIEPGIYIPGLGGVRIEDMVIVRKNGCENLYKSKKDFTFLS